MIDIYNLCFSPEWAFLRFAMLVGVCLAPALGIIGTMVVTRRISSLAGASTHAALGGFGLALFLQRVIQLEWFTPTLGAVIGAVAAAVAVGIVSIYAKEREDTVIGAVWAIGMSVGLLFLDRTPGYVDWQGYLFGSILLLTGEDLVMTLILDAVIIIPTVVFFPSLLAMTFDDTFTRLRGIHVTILYLGLLILTALTIVLLINLVGIMLVIALLTLPSAAAACYTSHLRTTMLLSAVFNVLFILSGLLLSCILSLPSGPTIVVLAGIVYAASMAFKKYFAQ
ncbi:MAG: metal ABC transporter permease [Lentisphaeria bacterium]|nr:metal ABC transporter permease [Lentisphaeria bacterium]